MILAGSLEETAVEIRQAGSKVLLIKIDLQNTQECINAVQVSLNKYLRVTYLKNYDNLTLEF